MKYEEQKEQALRLAAKEGFSHAVWLGTDQLQFDFGLRKYCEQNACGNYGKNFACPPDCGTPEEMKKRTEEYTDVLVLQTLNQVEDWNDPVQVKEARGRHNRMTYNLVNNLIQEGLTGLSVLAGPCTLCSPCAKAEGKLCRFAKRQASCLSAYCICAQDMAEKCGLSYWCGENIIAFFSLYLIKKPE